MKYLSHFNYFSFIHFCFDLFCWKVFFKSKRPVWRSSLWWSSRRVADCFSPLQIEFKSIVMCHYVIYHHDVSLWCIIMLYIIHLLYNLLSGFNAHIDCRCPLLKLRIKLLRPVKNSTIISTREPSGDSIRARKEYY